MSNILALSLLALTLLLSCQQAVLAVSHTPQKISLASRKISKNHATLRRALAAADVSLVDFFKGTDLQWYGNISVGTPRQEISVVFDTGSSTLEFATTQCATCRNQPQFNTSASSTYVQGNETTTLDFGTGVGVDPVQGSNYALDLLSGYDVVSVGGLNAGNVSFWTITNQTETFDVDPFSGIQGMSPQAQGFFAALIKQGLPSLFGMYLAPEAVGDAELTIGGYDASHFNGSLTYANLVNRASSFWELGTSQIAVNGVSSPLLQTKLDLIFDSGTSNIVLDTNYTEAIYALISPLIQPYAPEPGAYGAPCAALANLSGALDFTFTSASGAPFNLSVPGNALSVGAFADNASHCQTLVNALDGYRIVGGSVLKNYYSVWDVGGQRMGFAALGNSSIAAPGTQAGNGAVGRIPNICGALVLFFTLALGLFLM